MSDNETKAYTTFQAAKICHVTHHSIKNWIRQGLIKASRTPGGHYRILQEDLDSFRENFDMFPRERTPAKKKIMIVDDDPDALAMMEKILSNEGYELIKVSNATEVGLKAAQMTPDLILLDFLMPELDGFQVCRVLRESELTADTPIMAVTCLSKEEEIERIFEAGADDYLAKPFKVEQLLEKTSELLKRGRVAE